MEALGVVPVDPAEGRELDVLDRPPGLLASRPKFDSQTYKRRNIVERPFNLLKQWRGLATRYDRHAVVYRAGAVLGAHAHVSHVSPKRERGTCVRMRAGSVWFRSRRMSCRGTRRERTGQEFSASSASSCSS